MSRGRHGPSKQYFFGSQDGVIGASMQCRNPDISPAENVINTLLDVFFFEITPRTYGREASNIQVAKTVQFLGNPHFHLTCEGLKRTGEPEPGATLKLFVLSADIGRLQGKAFVQGSRSRALLGVGSIMSFSSRVGGGSGQFVGERYFNTDATVSAEELATRAEEWRAHLTVLAPSKPTVLPHDTFASTYTAAQWALNQARPFAAPDFALLLSRGSRHGAVPDASRSDKVCENAKELYRGLATFAVNYTPLIVSEKEIQRLLVAHHIGSLVEAGNLAQEAVCKRLDDARERYKIKQAAEEQRAATLGAARLAEWRREEIAAQRAEEKRLIEVERAREQALRDYHAQFQEYRFLRTLRTCWISLNQEVGFRHRFGEVRNW